MTLHSLADLSALSKDAFVAHLAGVYEHSAWIAEEAYAQRPFASLGELHTALKAVVAGAGHEPQMALIRHHPDLAGRAALAGNLTADSTDEQAAAGLDSLTPEELARFTALNDAYRARFEMPFIMAVRNADKARILAAFAVRINNDPAIEVKTALAEIHKIAWMRLLTLVIPASTGRLTTHVLDTGLGKPAGGLPLALWRIEGDTKSLVGRYVTNADGRLDAPALAGSTMRAGVYEWLFEAGVYFAATGQVTSSPPFLDRIPLRFALENPESHYHVPLLVSPWSFSTYRGS